MSVNIYKDGGLKKVASKGIGDADTIVFDNTDTDLTSTNIQDVIEEINSNKADSATTLESYGITDAKINSGVITLGSNTITPLTADSTLDATKISGTLPSSTYTDTKVTSAGTTLTTITASTDDITAGTTALATGQLYVVYE